MILSLGTPQFGVRSGYGVNNAKGGLTDAEAEALLDAARRAGFTMVDTSSEYGLAEERIGAYLRKHPGAFEVNGKYNAQYPRERIEELKRRTRERTGRLDHVMFYCVDVDVAYLDPDGADGISVYSVDEARAVDGKPYRFIQVPGSILDGRMDAEIKRQQAMGRKVLVRSILLQGLLAMDPNGTLSGNIGNGSFISSARLYLDGLKVIGDFYGLTVMEMAARWAWHLAPDVAIFGAETPEQVTAIGEFIRRGELSYLVIDAVLTLRKDIPEIVISPRMWGQTYNFTPSKVDR